MIKNLIIFAMAFLGCCVDTSAQQVLQTGTPVFKAETTVAVDRTIFKPGEKIPLKIVCLCPEGTHQVGSWSLGAYLTDIPEGFEKIPGFVIRPNKDPRWSYVDVKQGCWFGFAQRKKREFQVEIDTTGWPEGDYRMNVNITFQPIVAGETFIYRAGAFTFTIEK